jgi:hypothetical protein
LSTWAAWPANDSQSADTTYIFYSDPQDASGSELNYVPYFNITFNGTDIFVDESNQNQLVLVTDNGTAVLDLVAGFFDFFTPDCSLEIRIPISDFNNGSTTTLSKKSLNKREPSIPLVGTPVTVLLSPNDACGNPLNHLSPPTVLQMVSQYTYDCSDCDPAPKYGQYVCLSTCIYPGSAQTCLSDIQQWLTQVLGNSGTLAHFLVVFKDTCDLDTTIASLLASLVGIAIFPSLSYLQLKAVESSVCLFLEHVVNVAFTPLLAYACDYFTPLSFPDVVLAVNEVQSALTWETTLDLIPTPLLSPTQAGTVVGPYNVELTATFPEYWVGPGNNIFQNGDFDYGICTIAATYEPWLTSGIGTDDEWPGNGVWYTTGGEDGSLGCASGKTGDMCM